MSCLCVCLCVSGTCAQLCYSWTCKEKGSSHVPQPGQRSQVLWPQWCWAGVAGRKWPLSVPHLTEYDNSTEIQILHLLLKKYKEKGRRGRNGKLLYLFVCIADVFPDVVRVCSFFYDIWESPVCWDLAEVASNASVSHIPICKIQVVKLISSGWADLTESTSGQGPSFTIEEYDIGKVIKKYPSKLFLIENCVFNRGYRHTNQLLYIVEKLL